ncbi:MAG TPA: LytTR family DNA-binding domain-containing protein [Steroidobacteraceae bacterium]|jgi:two-component system LytT family response regulator|nr:LytTR family DNA-binding domain-containing protein [Steroidobacteraceae bacterium]
MAENGTARVRALIVDDEELGRRMLRSLLDPDEEVQVVGEAASAAEARRKISEQKPDLVFMDIEMPGGNGLEVLQDLGEFVPYVIFVTAHPEFALPAFEVQASDYLVKPVQRQRFLGSVMRAKKRIAERRVAGLARQIAGAMGTNGSGAAAPRQSAQPPAQKYADQMTIRVRRRMFSLEVSDISWIQGASQYSRVHTKNGEYLLSRTLASLECELDPRRFFRIHRSAIVNAAHVREVRSSGDGRYNIYLHGGQALPMGRARREILEKLLSGIGAKDN